MFESPFQASSSGEAVASGAGERRVHARYTCALPSFCQPGRGRMDLFWRRVKVQNLSTHGIGLLLNLPYEPGTVLTVEMVNSNHTFSRQALVKVVYTQAHGRHEWLTGCTFLQQLQADDLPNLLS